VGNQRRFLRNIAKMKWFYICISDASRVYTSPIAMSNYCGQAFSWVRGAGLTPPGRRSLPEVSFFTKQVLCLQNHL
jgi:hypothetical protein